MSYLRIKNLQWQEIHKTKVKLEGIKPKTSFFSAPYWYCHFSINVNGRHRRLAVEESHASHKPLDFYKTKSSSEYSKGISCSLLSFKFFLINSLHCPESKICKIYSDSIVAMCVFFPTVTSAKSLSSSSLNSSFTFVESFTYPELMT